MALVFTVNWPNSALRKSCGQNTSLCLSCEANLQVADQKRVDAWIHDLKESHKVEKEISCERSLLWSEKTEVLMKSPCLIQGQLAPLSQATNETDAEVRSGDAYPHSKWRCGDWGC